MPAYSTLDALFKAANASNFTYEQWVAASNSKSDVSKWRRLLEWPFGENDGVYRFNKEGNAVYLITSRGRCVPACVSF